MDRNIRSFIRFADTESIYVSLLVKLDQDSGHVIHPILVSWVFRHELIKQFLTNGLELSVIQSLLDPIDHFLISLDLPDTITTHDNKVYVLVFDFSDVGFGSDHLLLSREGVVLLVLAVAEGTAEVQSTVNTTETDHSSCFGDSIYLLWILWFMVPTQLLSLTIHTGHSPGVTSISTIHILRRNQHHISRTPSMRLLLIFRPIINLSHFLLYSHNLLPTRLTKYQLVHSQKCLLQG